MAAPRAGAGTIVESVGVLPLLGTDFGMGVDAVFLLCSGFFSVRQEVGVEALITETCIRTCTVALGIWGRQGQ